MTTKTKTRDLTTLSTRELKAKAEAIMTANTVDGAALAAIDIELRRRKAESALPARDTDKIRESRLRRKAASYDLRLTKSRRRDPHALDHGMYGLIMNSCNGMVNPATVDGGICSWTLDDVEQYLTSDE